MITIRVRRQTSRSFALSVLVEVASYVVVAVNSLIAAFLQVHENEPDAQLTYAFGTLLDDLTICNRTKNGQVKLCNKLAIHMIVHTDRFSVTATR